MSRLMSVALTEEAVVARRKTVTRRKGWPHNLPPDEVGRLLALVRAAVPSEAVTPPPSGVWTTTSHVTAEQLEADRPGLELATQLGLAQHDAAGYRCYTFSPAREAVTPLDSALDLPFVATKAESDLANALDNLVAPWDIRVALRHTGQRLASLPTDPTPGQPETPE